MLGGSLTPKPSHGFAFDIALCALPQLCGADATVFPNVGGRFGFTLEECQSIVRVRLFRHLRPPLSLSPQAPKKLNLSLSLSLSLFVFAGAGVPRVPKPIAATPGGGMTLDRIPEILQVLGRDITLLVGGSVFARSPNLEENAAAFVSSTGRKPVRLTTANSAPTQEQLDQVRRLRALKYPSVDGNHSKFLEFKANFSGSGAMGAEDSSHWLGVALENYKPEAGARAGKGLRGRSLWAGGRRVRSFTSGTSRSRPGHSSLEKRARARGDLRQGERKCVVGTRVWDMKPLDLCYTLALGTCTSSTAVTMQNESFGFFCIVNAERDRPVLVDPNGQEMAGLAGKLQLINN